MLSLHRTAIAEGLWCSAEAGKTLKSAASCALQRCAPYGTSWPWPCLTSSRKAMNCPSQGTPHRRITIAVAIMPYNAGLGPSGGLSSSYSRPWHG